MLNKREAIMLSDLNNMEEELITEDYVRYLEEMKANTLVND
jgi:hypothetical protein